MSKQQKNFFTILSEIVSAWINEATSSEIKPIRPDLIEDTKKIIQELTQTEPHDEIHKQIYKKTANILKTIIQDLTKTRIIKALTLQYLLNEKPQNLTQHEKQLIEKTITILTKQPEPKQKENQNPLQTTNKIITTKQQNKKTRELVIIKAKLGQITGTDTITYDLTKPGTIANIPKENIETIKQKTKHTIEQIKTKTNKPQKQNTKKPNDFKKHKLK